MSETSITRITLDEAKKLEDLTDSERVNSMSEAEIEANALSDPDNQPLSPDRLKKVRRIKSKDHSRR
ncbi:MAG: hypothetical protein QNJ55_34545 [Xenococcus sp. MO_188.B8]|nr:hypothetical protein [Xenococcus sp. MO_188.B8]